MNSLTAAACVAVGGAAGSLLRWFAGLTIQRAFPGSIFPWATLTVNLTGCFLFGVAAAFVLHPAGEREPLRLLLLTGLLGGFTTFSSFSYETLKLVHDGRPDLALANVATQVLLGVAACWAGMWATRLALNITG